MWMMQMETGRTARFVLGHPTVIASISGAGRGETRGLQVFLGFAETAL